ncbi:hypothetical protein [Cohnella panacarvi]|uniref:hypothetical protein n=1 Tax=Cohnella panacarvi TaxID=400776 RepID=UPI00047B0B72|nr:hypothetical protein [Cohnella panacarvi]
MTRIGCFHAHYSNIEQIDDALSDYDVECIHFVDPGLDRIKNEPDFTREQAERKVLDTLNWIARSQVDAILVTCTFYAALIRDDIHRFPVPIVKIDEPLFQDLLNGAQPIVLVFTNPNTVDGTLGRLRRYFEEHGAALDASARIVPGTFELIMQGKKDQYLEQVASGMIGIARELPDQTIVAAQLSMVPAARKASEATGTAIGNAAVSLAEYLSRLLSLEFKPR